MTQVIYKIILRKNVLSSALTMFLNSEDQENASCHTASSINMWVENQKIKTLSWSTQSPDLTPHTNL